MSNQTNSQTNSSATTADGQPHGGPLAGIRVLEFSQIIAGPFGCQNLADMGAEVIKVEPPDGEAWRQFSQFMPGESKWFQSLNRGKRSLVLPCASLRRSRSSIA